MEPTRGLERLRSICDALARKAHRKGMGTEEGEEESGFTLIELMVVLLIMAILLAIAIPTFLSVKGGAQDRAAQSNLTNAITAAKAFFTNNNGTYPAATTLATNLGSSEPEFTWQTGSSTTQNQISVAVSGDGNVVVLAVKSSSGRCWFAEDNEESSATADGLTGATSSQGVTYAELGSSSATACLAAGSGTPTTYSASYPAPS